jgi:NAD(P)-dependent dehydrogenase (short-subunit alcohol dehydrogenase family)
MSKRLDGKVALITGGASGIGAAHAAIFSENGAKVVVCDIQDSKGQGVVDKINASGGDAIYQHLDVVSEAEWTSAIQAAVNAFGGLTTLINNAGFGNVKGVEEESLAGFNKVVEVCQTGVWLGMKAVMPELKKCGNGAIVNISSLYGIIGTPSMVSYHGAKGAVRLMTKSAALEYAQQGVRINSVHPGIIKTPAVAGLPQKYVDQAAQVTPMGHLGKPEDIAHGSLYLCSDEAAFVTGSELVIDGGWGCG